jgi:hypothetical protein
MSTPEAGHGAAHLVLTEETILNWTQFSLAGEFTEFARDNGDVSPELHEERERFSEQYGEDNVLTSFFVTQEGNLALGLFVRTP